MIYIGDERVDDATERPAWRDIARICAELYDLDPAPDNRDPMSYEEDGERYSIYSPRPRSKEDPERRTPAHGFIATPSRVMSNHQCNVRFREKQRFVVGIAGLITKATAAHEIPAVRETPARLAAVEAGCAAILDAQIHAFHDIEHGYVLFNRRSMYAALHRAMESHRKCSTSCASRSAARSSA